VEQFATVFVALLGEGVDVWRPVTAESLGSGFYRLAGSVPDTEIWQFSPGTVVRCESHTFTDGDCGLIAVE
jgi:hypothetical protein